MACCHRPFLQRLGLLAATSLLTLRLAGQPLTSLWSPVPDLPADRPYSAAVAAGGKLYVVGGAAGTDVFDLRGNAWASLGSGPTRRDFPGAAALGERVYVVGGVDGGKNREAVEVLDTVNRAWLPGPPLGVPRSRLAVVAAGGKVYAIGGYVGDGRGAADTNAVEEYEPDARSWVRKANMPTRRHGHAAVVVKDRILVIGGYGDAGKGYGPLDTVEEYNPKADRWAARAVMPTPRGFLGAAMIGGKVYAIGGRVAGSPVERYDPAADAWTRLGDAPSSVQRSGIASLGDVIYVVGGKDRPRKVWRFRPGAE